MLTHQQLNRQQLNRQEIAALIPHGHAMCLLDEVVHWDAEHIHCRSSHFAGSHNPLFEAGQLESVLLIEYAAQAAAIHAGLLQSQLGKARPAYIGAVKNIELLKPLSDNQLALEVVAQCLLSSSNGAIYDVVVSQENCPVMQGRLILNQP